MLVTSLPYPGDLFTAKQTPLSRIKLDGRLGMLSDADADLLKRIENVLQWSHQPMERSDAQIVAMAKELVEHLESPLLRQVVEFRLNLRTVVAALRRRKLGQAAPAAREPWGYGPWVDHIRRHWSEAGFRLEGAFPWILEANRLLNADDVMGLERLLLGVVWDHLGRAAEGHYLDFEAVVIYVLRWNVVDRWTTYDADAAVERFESLVDSGLGDSATLFA
jgi:hypothetical protein